MSVFKDQVQKDIQNTFLNIDEFSDVHVINGSEMAVQVDNIEQIEREKRSGKTTDGIYTQQKLFYVRAEDFGPLPKQGSLLRFDKKMFKVADAIEEDGVYSITLEANRS